jgi:endonuclease/exonuclease/phosphatase family metal-dependent hydrolase
VLPFLKREKPDVVCFQELLEEDFVMYKKELEMNGVMRTTSYITDNVHTESRGKREGVAIFSKNIDNHGYYFYVGGVDNIDRTFDEYIKDDPAIKSRVLLWADIKIENGDTFRVINSHMPLTYQGEVTQEQIEANDIFIEQAKKLEEFVFCGDTNAPRGLRAFDRIAEEFKDNIPLKYISSLDPELHRAKGINYMIDCMFTTPKYQAFNVELKSGVSDHMAVVAEISKK